MHRYRILTAVALAGLLFTACEDDWLGGKSADKNTVSFTLLTSGIATRSDARPAEESVIATHVYDLHDTSPEGEPLMLVETVTAIGDEEEGCNGYTRGDVITTDNFQTYFATSGFTGIGYAADGSSYLGTAQFKFDGEKDAWTHFYDNNIAWIDDGIYYVLYAGNAGKDLSGLSNIAYTTPSSDGGTVSFSYAMPSASSADSHQDLLFTTKHIKKAQAGTAQPITFYHMLTALRFKDGYKGEGTSVNTFTSVTLKGLYNQGTCTFQADPDFKSDEGIKKSETFSSDNLYQVNWSNQSNTSQNYELTSASQNLWVIPQSVTDGHSMTMEVKYKFGTEGSVHKKDITFPAGTVWKAGERHTFSINPVNVVPAVTVSKSTTVTGQYTATITNTGNYPVYMRAVIVPTWTDGNGNVINVPWEGTITWGGTTTSDWYDPVDNTFVYKSIVQALRTTQDLVFKLNTSSTPSVEGEKLRVDVAVQSVASNELNATNPLQSIGWLTTN